MQLPNEAKFIFLDEDRGLLFVSSPKEGSSVHVAMDVV